MMNRVRFDEIVAKLHELTATGDTAPHSGAEIDWVYGEKFSPLESGATLDELREVGQAYGLYLHHCSHCDRWYFAWFKSLEEARQWEQRFKESQSQPRTGETV